jgi:hypothetical protein
MAMTIFYTYILNDIDFFSILFNRSILYYTHSVNTFRDWVSDEEVTAANARTASTSRTRVPPFAITTEL